MYKAVRKVRMGWMLGVTGTKQNSKRGQISTCKFSNCKVLGSVGGLCTQEPFRTAGRKKSSSFVHYLTPLSSVLKYFSFCTDTVESRYKGIINHGTWPQRVYMPVEEIRHICGTRDKSWIKGLKLLECLLWVEHYYRHKKKDTKMMKTFLHLLWLSDLILFSFLGYAKQWQTDKI